jgi:diguanylate cyclase (GGDEF)-like protein/PAS domain S-box-containing protein
MQGAAILCSNEDDVLAKLGLKRPHGPFKSLMASLQPAPLLCLSMVVVLWTVVTLILLTEHQRSLDSAIQQGSNLVRLFEQNTTSMLRGVDRTLLLLRQAYEEDPAHSDLNALVKRSITTDDLTTQFAIADQDGHAKALIASNGTFGTAYFGDRPYFQQQRDTNDDRLLVGNPTPGRLSNKLSIVLSRRLRNPDGSFAGVIGAAIDPNFIGSFYKTIDLGASGSVILRDLNGIILASAGTVGPTNGRQVMQPALRNALAKSPVGYYWGGGAVDGVNRLVSYRTSQDLPVVMMVGLAEDDIFASYAYTRELAILAAIFLTLVLVLGTISSFRHHLRLNRSLTARLIAERNLKHANTFLDTIVENLPLPVVVKDAKTLQFQLVNHAYEAFIGMSREQLVGKTVHEIFPPQDAELIVNSDREASNSNDLPIATEFVLHTPTNGLRTVATTRLIVRDEEGGPSHLITVLEDITDRRESDKKIFYMAHHDALTGLANRAAVAQKIEDAAARQRRWGYPFTVLMLDLDRFKHVNDTLGHSGGDALLREVATRLIGFLRETDVLARLGGDEFVIIQAGETNQREAASTLADRIIDIIAKPFNIEGSEINIGTSIGISLAPEHATDPESLLKMADMALYSAKSSGRGGHRFFEIEMNEAASLRRQVETELRHAIHNDELELYYQPIIDAKTRRICGAEALIRWRHPTKGMILPEHFIPLAEETGLITQIGEWVLLTACVEAARWPVGVKIAVNLSPVQFSKCNLIDVVLYALAQSKLPPERLELEITETALIESATECLPVLRQLKNLGISIALDDFGTGYSSLSQMTIFPFDKIKIDKSFTLNMTRRADCAAIISATLTLATSLDITTTAEGVETAEQYQLLQLAGVTSLQGHLFKRPSPASELDFTYVYGGLRIEDAA